VPARAWGFKSPLRHDNSPGQALWTTGQEAGCQQFVINRRLTLAGGTAEAIRPLTCPPDSPAHYGLPAGRLGLASGRAVPDSGRTAGCGPA
jgi:hypothetical protein